MGKLIQPGDEIEKETTANLRMILEKSTIHMMLKCVNLGSLIAFHYKFQKAKRNVKNFVYKLINEKLVRIKNNAEKIIANAEESIKKSPNDIIAESNNIVLASADTIANGLYSTLLMLALHPEVQERLFNEIVNVYPEKDFETEYEHLEQFPYLDMVLNETLRLAPSVPLIGRHVMKDLQLTKDLTLPKDLQIIVSIYHLHRRKDTWGPNADKFDPNNFLLENIARKHPYTFIPFSKGQRNCIGWRYAIFALKVLLVGIVRNYRFSTDAKYDDIQYAFGIVLRRLNELRIKIFRRD